MKRFKGCLGVFLIFFFGVLFGCAITEAGFSKRLMKLVRRGPEGITDGTVKWLKKDLKLDSEQAEMLKQIAIDTRIKLRKIHQTTQPEVEQTLTEAAERTRGILNPDQVKRFDEIVLKGMRKWKTSEAPALTNAEPTQAGSPVSEAAAPQPIKAIPEETP